MSTTQIRQRQIADGAINNAKVQAGAGIVTTKLADGAEFIQRSGSVAMTGNLDLGSQKIVNLQTGSGNNDAVNVGQLNSAIANLNSMFTSKAPARAMATGNILISNPGTSTFDTVTLSNGDRLFLGNQTAPAENGIYIFNGSGIALTRVSDMDIWAETVGSLFSIEEGSVNISKLILFTIPQAGTINTTAITYQVVNAATGLSNSNFVDKEVPSGSINGSNTTFTLANTPVLGSEHVYINGLLMELGSGNDYTISGTTITTLDVLATGEKIRVSYRK